MDADSVTNVGRLRALYDASAHYQMANVLFMAFQSFVAPIFIGIGSYGAQMLFVAPVLLAQALLEPSFQAELNASADGHRCRINPVTATMQSAILIGITFPFAIGDYNDWLLLALFAGLALFTFVLAACFALRDVALAATGRYVSLAVYLIAFGFMLVTGGEGEIIVANLAAVTAGSAVIGAVLLNRGSILPTRSPPTVRFLLGGLSFRLPIVSFTAMTTILLGYTGALPTTIGEFRIFMAAATSGRFINPIPLAELQSAIHRFLSIGDRTIVRLARRFLVSLAAFAIATALLFPPIYRWAFGDFTFSPLSLLVASTFAAAQPLAYFIFAARTRSMVFNVAFPVALSLGLMVGFYAIVSVTHEPDLAAAVTIGALLAIYAAVAALTKTTNETTG